MVMVAVYMIYVIPSSRPSSSPSGGKDPRLKLPQDETEKSDPR